MPPSSISRVYVYSLNNHVQIDVVINTTSYNVQNHQVIIELYEFKNNGQNVINV